MLLYMNIIIYDLKYLTAAPIRFAEFCFRIFPKRKIFLKNLLEIDSIGCLPISDSVQHSDHLILV